MTVESGAVTLRKVFGRLMAAELAPAGGPEYLLGASLGVSYAGVSRKGAASLLVPLQSQPGAVARSGGGCLLRPAPEVEFVFGGRRWMQPAAVLECSDPAVLDVFAVLACDVAGRVTVGAGEAPAWQDVARIVDEWYSLLARRGRLSSEAEIGLWGELWFISQAADPDRVIAAWTGPGGGPTDFSIGAVSAEVKAGRTRLRHFVSQDQADRPTQATESYIVSLWVGPDTEVGITVPVLADQILTKSADPSVFLSLLLTTGYSPADRHEYHRALMLLDDPRWFEADSIPRVRVADPGISSLRYVVDLDLAKALSAEETAVLSRHFLGAPVFETEATGLAGASE